MASRYNLTPERKEKLKKEVMDEIGKTNSSRMKPRREEKPLLRQNPQPKVFKVEVKKPIILKSEIKPEEIKKEIKKAPVDKKPADIKLEPELEPVRRIVKPKVIKKKINKPVQKQFNKPKKVMVVPLVKIPKKVSPAPSPISKKPIAKDQGDSFFKPDSLVKPSFSYKRIFKPKIRIGHKKIFILGAIFCVILGLILAVAINIFGIYKFGWNGAISQSVVHVLPLPAGTVDGRMIKLSDYYNDFNIIQTVLTSGATSTTNTPLSDNTKIKEQLFNRLVSVNIIENELKKYGQAVTDKNISEEMDKVVSQIGSIEKATDDIKSTYGMDISSFKTNVLKPIIAMDLLSKLITSDENLDINKEAKKNADDALRIALEPGTDFKTLVLQFATDPSTLNQLGDMGWFSRGELPQEIEEAIFSLKDGEVYNQVVKDEYGYHIYKVESRLIDQASGKESIKLSQIFITVNTELYIKSLFDKAVIKRFI
ncbi:MAG: peptidylprolyl isomerase [Patescibacteria group bacterium]